MVNRTPEQIVNDVCLILELNVEDVLSYRRKEDYTDARFIIANILFNQCYSCRKIAKILQKKTHSQASKANKKCQQFIINNMIFKQKYDRVMTVINA